ncbi:5-formyltetrahydrofolate cyclo-ligase [Spirosoma endbachense]|uniref:5-formyltetrahydrofolate cyclo-ligase n=1 Tax=Spirosoma endbachense TaxID=2666025 RepID=A0A6P1W0E4_9BACT|nr:5-formyltetrahydrofolate cyclo-ligase [Spirosoma endbachense]QHV98505.1 5-formyltetrahydrofolate cyclo-ligase [Spirosoma endbachense]
MTKAELRRHFLGLRKALPVAEIEARSQQICQLFFNQNWMDSSPIVHTFLPILRQNEVNTWPIIHRLWADFPAVRVIASVTDAKAHHLTHYELTPNTVLVENHWGIPEPVSDQSLASKAASIDIVLVPLLAFDPSGHRVGYGGGFYDRFLANCRPDCLTVGLSLVEPVDHIDGIEQTDIPLEVCITPEQVWFFSK